MADHLEFLFDLVAARRGWPDAGSTRLTLDAVLWMARARGLDLPDPDSLAMGPDEEEDAARLVSYFVDDVADSILGGDASAGRESLNTLLDAWVVTVALEEELGDDELPGVELTATLVPPAPPTPQQRVFEGRRDGARLHGTASAPLLLALASCLLSTCANLHLGGYADRVRRCAATECARPFRDTSDSGTRVWCSARCRAREGARRTARGARRTA